MKKAIKEILTLLLCVAAWTYAADSSQVKLIISDSQGYLLFIDGEGCALTSLPDFYSGKCLQGAVIKVKTMPKFGALLKLKCWQSSEICVSTGDTLELKVSSDTVLQALFEKNDIDLSMNISKYSGRYKFPVLGRDSFKIENKLFFEDKDYAYIVYQYNSGNGYKNMMNPVKVSKNEGLPKELSTISISHEFGTEISANEQVWKHSFKKDSKVYFRIAAAFEEGSLINQAGDIFYSEELPNHFEHPEELESVSGIKIRSNTFYYGQEVYIVMDKDKIGVPANDDKYVYDYRWHRVGASGNEYLSSDVEYVTMGDSLHYKAELIKLPKKELPEMAFAVTGIEIGHSAEDVNIKTPNECFIVSNVRLLQKSDEDVGTLKEGFGTLNASIAVSDVDSCTGNLQANVWRYYAKDKEGADIYTVNGLEKKRNINKSFHDFYCDFHEVVFLDDDEENVLKRVIVAEGLSVTPPEAPEREGYVFKGWDKDEFDHVTRNMTVHAQYEEIEPSSSSAESSSSSVKAKSSSSSAKAKSSSSKGKSSSSKGGKDAIASAAQVLQFSLATVGREIQVAGARVGSAYAVLDMQGRVIAKGRVSATDFSIRMDRSATYLVRIGNQTQTVKIK